jgi:REP element-mobilizing transposase RayT
MGSVISIRDKTLVKLSAYGSIIKTEWLKSFEIRQELFLDKYIIMPNHLHAIIILNTNEPSLKNGNETTNSNESKIENVIETHGRASQRENIEGRASQRANIEDRLSQSENNNNPTNAVIIKNNSDSKNQSLIRLPKSISSFIAGFKSSVNTEIDNYIDKNKLNIPKYNKNNHFFQPNYHDHVIRNKKEYYRIKNYIINNPKNWVEDSLLKDT